MDTTDSVSQLQIPGAGSIHPTSIVSLIHCSRPSHAAWEWDFPSAARSLRATTVGFGCRTARREAQFFRSSYLPTPSNISPAPFEKYSMSLNTNPQIVFVCKEKAPTPRDEPWHRGKTGTLIDTEPF